MYMQPLTIELGEYIHFANHIMTRGIHSKIQCSPVTYLSNKGEMVQQSTNFELKVT